MRAVLLLFACALWGCQTDTGGPVEGSPVVSDTAEPADQATASAPETLVGEWRVGSVDGQPIDLPHGIAMIITEDRIMVNSGCVNLGWSYRYANGELHAESQPQASCRRAYFREEEGLISALAGAASVHRTETNGIEIAGSANSITLFSQ